MNSEQNSYSSFIAWRMQNLQQDKIKYKLKAMHDARYDIHVKQIDELIKDLKFKIKNNAETI